MSVVCRKETVYVAECDVPGCNARGPITRHHGRAVTLAVEDGWTVSSEACICTEDDAAHDAARAEGK